MNKLLLNQWLISLFGIDPLQEYNSPSAKTIRPFHRLSDPIKDPRMEGFDHDNLHKFYHNLINSDIFWNHSHALSKEQILIYEENITRHTMAINKKRHRPIVWKYYQWLTLLFAEIYLDRYFNNRHFAFWAMQSIRSTNENINIGSSCHRVLSWEPIIYDWRLFVC